MFDKILIANRGEIACRVIRTARAMGVRTVAVYSDADATALHVELADEAIHLGPSPVSESYLKGDAIIAAALATGAEAIHPGYGFLSENPDFVEAVEAAGLVFIGPSAKAIRAMGLKDAAKALMEQAGVPVVPGYHGADQSDDLLAAEAGRIGYPVLIKAVAGGGGKGMRLVEDPADFVEALASARAEAKTAFGNPDVLIEKFVTHPRHIEVQVFGDGTRAVHLFERDCSLQRRHQKVIEEAPAPGMTEKVRAAMGAAAVRAAEAIGYSGAGTVEFIVDGSGPLHADGFWFMEMNTRLQVEHPVTEAITGVDLVEWQLRVAAGEPLPARQEDLEINGHAFEARLYAEDVPAGFLPATGRLAHLAFPAQVRADSGVRAGDDISPFYDPMIAKVIVHGPDRDSALRRLSRGLAETQVAGTVTNLSFLKALTDHTGFAAGQVDTGLIARDLADLTQVPEVTPQVVAQAALILSDLWDGGAPTRGFALWAPLARTVETTAGPVVLQVRGPDSVLVSVDGLVVEALRDRLGWTFDGDRAVPFARHPCGVTLFDGVGREIGLVDLLDRGSATGAGGDAVLAPMPGLVTALFTTVGAEVKEGDRLATLEAMKMEHTLRAPRDGTVARIGAEPGGQVEAGAPIVVLDPEGEVT
ncbi:acetyl/propionyl/methylcrotonyl-CoA carboxylase subunit alpha [Marivivens marinus]|uniref:acetyl/propionyl/methylcrotonyl-CoA carboxylase subunit alpha n=1 Tax=Marivivens marinus TaxID=3110173 RepID=UPI003B847579